MLSLEPQRLKSPTDHRPASSLRGAVFRGVSGPGREVVAIARTKRSLPTTLKISAGCGKIRPLSFRASSLVPPKNLTLGWGRDHHISRSGRAGSGDAFASFHRVKQADCRAGRRGVMSPFCWLSQGLFAAGAASAAGAIRSQQ